MSDDKKDKDKNKASEIFKTFKSLEFKSSAGLMYYVFSLPGVLFALNLWLLFTAAQTIGLISYSNMYNVLGVLMLGSTFGIAYPFYRYDYTHNEDVAAGGEPLTPTEKARLRGILSAIVIIQSLIFIFLMFNAYDTYINSPAFYALHKEGYSQDDYMNAYYAYKEYRSTVIWAMVSVILGIFVDFFLGASVTIVIDNAKKADKKASGGTPPTAPSGGSPTFTPVSITDMNKVAEFIAKNAGMNRSRTFNKISNDDTLKALAHEYGNKMEQARVALAAVYPAIKDKNAFEASTDAIKNSSQGKAYGSMVVEFNDKWRLAVAGN